MKIRPGNDQDHEALVEIWLRSVRATHEFLSEAEIQELLRMCVNPRSLSWSCGFSAATRIFPWDSWGWSAHLSSCLLRLVRNLRLWLPGGKAQVMEVARWKRRIAAEQSFRGCGFARQVFE